MHRTIISLVLALTLAGCFPGSPDALRREAAGREEYVVAGGYQEVYRRLAPMMRQCMESTWIGDNLSVRAELFTDIRKAELAVEGVNALLGRRVELLIELEATAERETRVRVWQPIRESIHPRVREWAEGTRKDCDAIKLL